MTIKKLTAMPYAQAHIEIDENGKATLFSYVTRVAEINAEGWVTIFGLYSQTTRKHISAFIREYTKGALTYQHAKHAYELCHKINYYTGEIVEMEG